MSRIDEEIGHVDYGLGSLLKIKWILPVGLLFIFTIFSYIPVAKKIDEVVYSSLKSIPGCSIKMKDYYFEFFLPKLVISDLQIPGRCINRDASDIKLNRINLFFRGLSFSPFGLSIKAETEYKSSPIEAFIIPGFSGFSLLLENDSSHGKFTSPENQLNLNDLSEFIPKVSLNGNIILSTVFLQMGYNGKLKDLVLNISSNDLLFPSQKIMGFRIDKMNIENLLIQANLLKGKKLHLKKIVLGSEKSPIISNFSGELNINTRSFRASAINLKGELKISEKLLNSIILLKGYLGQFDKKDKFYQIQVKGSISKPKLSSAR